MAARKAFVVGQFFSQGARDGGEEQVIGFFGKGAKEATAQLGRKSEGDQEVGRVDQFVKFACTQRRVASGAALRTGFVVAGVIGEMNLIAGLANKGAPAQGRGAAMSDGPDGAALLR